ncbi:receptor-type tyrosine-protein phosphatase epsilon-like isoform X2 [Ostrea edulis]|uniref:receptor-type tyrosine-protein phosphatase epsilon-like isoform X2 n=1 Tax=Ostrea edulis TaxID=37623 RepID=UPI0024AE96DC|nr:receptor-type tyrosine-protein phosphatase epsilon-like isoform X2 [Ostrea edulis]
MFPVQPVFYFRVLAMASIQWTYILLLTGLGQCYVNLSRERSTNVSQSSTYDNTLQAGYAKDGNRTQTDYRICSHTALGHTIAWFQVDLGDEYSLKSVKIYYRNETVWPPYRFRQFYLDVSNATANSTTTLTSQRIRCYKDNTTEAATPPAVIDIPCKETARYVIVETKYKAPEAEKPNQTGPVLEICEIEVYGCSVGTYGESCSLCENCSTCDIISGACPCGDTCVNAACNPSNGYCTEGCITGYWGNTCKSQCNQHCIENTCEQGNGTCTNDCAEFRYGYTCEHQCDPQCSPRTCDRVTGACSDCNAGYHGLFCNRTCSPYCKSVTCDAHNGHCIGGCKTNWAGDLCDTLFASSSESPKLPVMAIGAGVGGVLIVLIAVIVTIVIFRFRRQKQSNSSTPSISYKTGSKIPTGNKQTNIATVSVSIEDPEEEPQSENPEEAVYYNNLSVAKDIAVKNLLNAIRQKEADKNAGFMKEFKSIPYGERFPCNTAKVEENKLKNRFKTTFPYDHSRVVLESGDGFTSDYINANYIENMDGRREYIASQGPRENTLVDHWRMVWQEHIQYIVMLTNLIEGPKVKCHQYWPSEGHELDVNPFSVTLLEEKAYAYYVIRKMTVRKKRVTGSRTVVQFHYTRWPDHGTPNPLNLVVFHRHFRHKIKPSQDPILVHCSAGIGRTGTFIALDVLSRYGDVHHRVNVVEFVKAMRKDRMTMIQNADQYVFLYHALYEYFRRQGNFVNKSEFMTSYADLDKPEAKKKITNEFNALKSLQPQYGGDDFKTGQKFLKLNWTKSVLPVEQYLVYLSSNVKGRELYYNAVYVSSFTQAEEFISAQYPVPGASIDLIRLLVDQKSPILISLNPLSDVKEIENWVDGENSRIDLVQYEITRSTQTMLSEELRTTSIKIKRKDSGEVHTVQIFECLSWSSSEILPNEHATLTNLIKHLSLDQKSHPEGPITVVSKDGATCCGVFLAVYNAVEQILQDEEADIFTIVQQLQCRRPEMISRKEEYEFCFRSVWYYFSSDNVYANT